MSPPFAKLLVANRGEIACRIMRTARRLGIRTVAIWSDADRDGSHVEMADEAYRIGPLPAAQSYLDIERIVEICRTAGVDAVHPGYGFLSERQAFAEALRAAGIGFVGPNPAAIGAMGDKISAKRLAAQAGVSVVPGYLGIIEDGEHAVSIADQIGYPVMIKASAGGGGKGMRIAYDPAQMAEGVERARSEATASFGDGRLFLEKFIVEPRHIEIQVLGDKHGNIVHLGERECSLQRRNQKVIEEAPSSFVDEPMRQAMGEQAVRLARAVGYDSAGTVEFMVGQDRSFYFLEMNTRLQVEHPVTELVTGLDLVEEMILSAADLPCRHRQQDIRIEGWATESRICAECPERGFLPSGGRLDIYHPGKSRSPHGRVRIDDGVREGDAVAIFYDPLIAKLITHAPSREEAIMLQSEALDSYAIEGVASNLDFLSDLMRHPRWRSGALSTSLIADEYGKTFVHRPLDGKERLHRSAVAAVIDAQRHLRWRREGMREGPQHLRLAVLDDDRRTDLDLDLHEGIATIIHNGAAFDILSAWRPGEPVWQGSIGGQAATFKVKLADEAITLSAGGRATTLRVMSRRQADLHKRMSAKATETRGGKVLSPLLGVLVRWFVAEGDRVSPGDPLCVLEAMKMEMTLNAEHDGVVTRLVVSPGAHVEANQPLLEFA